MVRFEGSIVSVKINMKFACKILHVYLFICLYTLERSKGNVMTLNSNDGDYNNKYNAEAEGSQKA